MEDIRLYSNLIVLFLFVCGIAVISTAFSMGFIQRALKRIIRRLDFIIDHEIVKCDVCKNEFLLRQLKTIDSGDKLCPGCFNRLKEIRPWKNNKE